MHFALKAGSKFSCDTRSVFDLVPELWKIQARANQVGLEAAMPRWPKRFFSWANEQITATWSEAVRVHLRPVIAAAKDGAIASEPAQIYLYQLGAFHALNLDEDTWESVDEALNYLLAR
jgi:hypothetical protein